MSAVVVGVDGGGTKTRVLAANTSGVLATAEGPGSAIRPGAAEHSSQVIATLVRSVLGALDSPVARAKVLRVGVAGAGRENERRTLEAFLEDTELADEVQVDTDAVIALDDAFGAGPGILLIAGTGSVAFARSQAGQISRCGGWGPVVGDEGSGAWIGRRALGIAAAAADGREPATALLGAILTATQLSEPGELIAWAASADPAAFGSLFPAIAGAAASGDPRARSLLDLAAEELVIHVRALAKSVFLDDRAAMSVAFSGGLLQRKSPIRSRVEHRLKSGVPGATVLDKDVDGARGAVWGALRQLHPATTP